MQGPWHGQFAMIWWRALRMSTWFLYMVWIILNIDCSLEVDVRGHVLSAIIYWVSLPVVMMWCMLAVWIICLWSWSLRFILYCYSFLTISLQAVVHATIHGSHHKTCMICQSIITIQFKCWNIFKLKWNCCIIAAIEIFGVISHVYIVRGSQCIIYYIFKN